MVPPFIWRKKTKKNISFVAPLCAMEAPFWDQSALCQELAKRRELLPQALSTYPEHAVPLGDEVMIHWSNGCSWENWCKYCVLPWKSLEVQDQAKHVFSLGWSIQRIPDPTNKQINFGLQGLPGLWMSCHSKAVEVYALEIQIVQWLKRAAIINSMFFTSNLRQIWVPYFPRRTNWKTYAP